jgi:hypothetical protein
VINKEIQIEIMNGISQYLNFLIDISKKELRAQGHYVTGKTEKSFKADVKYLGNNEYEGTISVLSSAIILNYGVLAKNVPYQQGSGKVKSLYIQALLEWAANVRPELSDKERTGFVFAVARKAKQEGHPTTGSYKFSSNGRRKDWIEFTIKPNEDKIFRYMNIDKVLSFEIQKSIRA